MIKVKTVEEWLEIIKSQSPYLQDLHRYIQANHEWFEDITNRLQNNRNRLLALYALRDELKLQTSKKPEPKKLTVEEINELLGYEVEIVKGE